MTVKTIYIIMILAFSTKCIYVTLDLQINLAVLLWDSVITLLISRWRGGTRKREFSSTGGSRVMADALFVAPFLATRLTHPGSPRRLICACRVTKKVFFCANYLHNRNRFCSRSHPDVLRRSSRVPTPRTGNHIGGLTEWRNEMVEYTEYSKLRNIRNILKHGIYRIF